MQALVFFLMTCMIHVHCCLIASDVHLCHYPLGDAIHYNGRAVTTLHNLWIPHF